MSKQSHLYVIRAVPENGRPFFEVVVYEDSPQKWRVEVAESTRLVLGVDPFPYQAASLRLAKAQATALLGRLLIDCKITEQAMTLKQYLSEPQKVSANGPSIQGYSIVYDDHTVVCRPGKGMSPVFIKEYIREMAEDLLPGGSAADHRNELFNMNNDGTWAVCQTKADKVWSKLRRSFGAPDSLAAALVAEWEHAGVLGAARALLDDWDEGTSVQHAVLDGPKFSWADSLYGVDFWTAVTCSFDYSRNHNDWVPVEL